MVKKNETKKVTEVAEKVVEEVTKDTVTLKIVKKFVDKYNKTEYIVGNTYEFSADRAQELLTDKRKLVEKIN